MAKILGLLKTSLKNHPIIANSVIYGTLIVGAEFSQQMITKKILTTDQKPLDTSAILRYAIYGTSIQGPLLCVWYRWLDRKFVGTATKVVFGKLMVDQFLFTPQLLVLFYVAMSVMENKPDIFEECSKKLLPTFKNSCLFWLPVQAINFLFVPPTFRVIYVGTCSFGWVNILCWLKRQEY